MNIVPTWTVSSMVSETTSQTFLHMLTVNVLLYLSMNHNFNEWLKTQPNEFALDVNKNEMLGNGYFTVADLIELDLKFNPEDEDK